MAEPKKEPEPDEQAKDRQPAVPKRDLSRAEVIAKKLAKVAPDDDPAVVAGAIVIFATENIQRSAKSLPDARAYLTGMRDAIDGLLVNAFPPPETSDDK
jgi:hypothetical protein